MKKISSRRRFFGHSSDTESTPPSGDTGDTQYMVIASAHYEAFSGATPVTLVTTLTHIYLGDEKIATFQSQTDDSPKTPDDDRIIYHFSDHLNSSSVDVSGTGLLLQAIDTLPYGQSNTYEVSQKRVKGKKGWYTNKYLFSGKQLDEEMDLQYFEKRYYDNRIGRFTTEDPVFYEVGLTKRPNQYFIDPQQWNTYSYVRNNPINLVDPTGEFAETPWDLVNVGYDAGSLAYREVLAVYNQFRANGTNDANQKQAYQDRANEYEKSSKDALIDLSSDALSAATPGLPVGTTKVLRVSSGIAKKTGELVTKNGIVIKGFTEHGIDRAIGGINRKGVSIIAILDALRNPLKINNPVTDSLGRTSQRFIGNAGEVVLNPKTGKIISVNPTSSKKASNLSRKGR